MSRVWATPTPAAIDVAAGNETRRTVPPTASRSAAATGSAVATATKTRAPAPRTAAPARLAETSSAGERGGLVRRQLRATTASVIRSTRSSVPGSAAPETCGNGYCEDSDYATCPWECGATTCGNLICDEPDYEQCPWECGVNSCNNGICDTTDYAPCPWECGNVSCGNAVCDGDDWTFCPWECQGGVCGNGICDPSDGMMPLGMRHLQQRALRPRGLEDLPGRMRRVQQRRVRSG